MSRFSFPSQHLEPGRAGPSTDRQPFLSESACRDIGRKLAQAATDGGVTGATIWSHWTGTTRWARNRIIASSDVRNDYIKVSRNILGAENPFVLLNQVTDEALVAAVKRAERLAGLDDESIEWDLAYKRYTPEPAETPALFSDATYQLDAGHRVESVLSLLKTAAASGMLAAGHVEVSAHSIALVDSLGRARYVPYTQASYSVTVRDPRGIGSGWAGMDWPDWRKIDARALTAIALDKCLRSRNPVAIEPGRYTTILEPQAVNDFVGLLFRAENRSGIGYARINKACDERDFGEFCASPFTSRKGDLQKGIVGMSLLSEKVVDERISVWSDPMDPELLFVPFRPKPEAQGNFRSTDVYHPATWIKDGVLTQLAYDRSYAIARLERDAGLPNEGGFRISGGPTSVDEMIATTKRGLLVSRFTSVRPVNYQSMLCRGFTRDGLWLIEDGKISKAVRNMVFTESIMFALNNVEQLGVPQRVFNPAVGRLTVPEPAVVPPLKIKDFSFTALTNAI